MAPSARKPRSSSRRSRARSTRPSGVDPDDPVRPRPDDGALPRERPELHLQPRRHATSARPAARRLSTVECFAIIKQGYCEYYAEHHGRAAPRSGVPARVAYGFLSSPNSRGDDDIETVGALARALVGRGLLPRRRLGRVRPHRQRRPAGAAPVRLRRPVDPAPEPLASRHARRSDQPAATLPPTTREDNPDRPGSGRSSRSRFILLVGVGAAGVRGLSPDAEADAPGPGVGLARRPRGAVRTRAAPVADGLRVRRCAGRRGARRRASS